MAVAAEHPPRHRWPAASARAAAAAADGRASQAASGPSRVGRVPHGGDDQRPPAWRQVTPTSGPRLCPAHCQGKWRRIPVSYVSQLR